MASRDLEVGLNIRLRDSASQPAQAAERNVQRAVQQTAQTYTDASRVAVTSSRMIFDLRRDQSAQAERVVQTTARQTAKTYEDTSRAAITSSRMMFDMRKQQSTQAEQSVRRDVQQTAAAQTQASRNALTGSQRLAAARTQLEVRSEQTIRREIDQTIAAYNRLARAGFASTNEQARAVAALRGRVAELNRELSETAKTESRIGRGIGTAWKVGGAAVGVGAAGMVVAPAVKESMDYGRRLAMMANTAYSDRDVAGRQQGARELDKSIRTAVRAGGGSPDQAADTLDSLLASGAISEKSAKALLPTLQKFATATGANPNELGNIAIRAMQNFGIKEDEVPKALDMALKGGQAGGFELRDMSKWLPQQMALAKQIGMSGLKDFGQLVVANQASVITAGTRDEAGNNLVNLLEKVNSQDTQIKAKKLGIDLTGSLASSRAQGVNALDAFVGIVQRVMSRDQRYQRTQRQLAHAPEGDRKAILESQADLLEGTSIGKLVHDRQALGALVAYMGQKDYRKQVASQVFDDKSAVDASFKTIQETPSFKTEQAGNELFFGRIDAMSKLDEKIGNVASSLTGYAQKYPGLTAAIEGATLAFKGVTAAVAPLAVFALLRGGGGAAAAGAAATAGVPGAVAAATGAASFGARFGRIARLGGPLGVGVQLVGSGIEAAELAGDQSLTPDQKKAGYAGVAGGAVGGVAGMAAGAALGAAAGSVVPGIGTAVGLVAGGVAGYFGHDFGERIGKMIGDAIFAQKKDEKPPVIEGHITVNLDGQHLFDTITTMNTRAAQRS
ncbi:phage tail tape measure protein [Burkholderia perseverans]|uniref:phage tail tape measure protein n=1 Tax=Burkholderia perseverans TaxID=2615214 RepID=UPI001FEEBCDB|nr:phage tail tape measure protein [Burkholderia perseverans]